MTRKLHAARVGVLLLACGIGAVTGVPTATAAPPSAPSDIGAAPLFPRFPFPPPRPPVFSLPRLPITLPETVTLPKPEVGIALDLAKLLRKPTANAQERVVAKASCKAMNAVLVGTGDRAYWEDAVRDEIPLTDWPTSFAEGVLVNAAVDRVSGTMSAAQHGPAFARFYLNACYAGKLG